MVQAEIKTSDNELQTKIYADVSEFGEFVIIRQGDDMVMIPAAPGTAEAKSTTLAKSLGI